MSDNEESAALTLRDLKARLKEYDSARGFERLSNAVVRGGLAGLAFRGVFFAVSSVASKLSRKKGRPSTSTSKMRMLSSTLRFAGFLATFAGVYVGADEALVVLAGKERTKAWRSLAAGMLAGTTLGMLDTREASRSLSIYIFVRGAVLMVKCGNLSDSPAWRRKLLALTRWEHGDVLLMCLASSRVLAYWLTHEEKPPSAYSKFLNKHGGKEMWVYAAVRELVALGGVSAPAELLSLRGTTSEGIRSRITCDFAHPGMSCVEHEARLFPAALLRAFPVYLPVYLVPAMLVHRKKLLTREGITEVAPKIAKGIARSSFFLALYITIAWGGICATQQAVGRTTFPVLALATFWSGLATLVEKKSRRLELALYVASRAVEGALPNAPAPAAPGALVSAPRRLLTASRRRADVLFFALASGAILHCYSDHYGKRRGVFRRPYLSCFDWIFGNTGHEFGSIRHHPSNAHYMALLGDQSQQAMRAISDQGALAYKNIQDQSSAAIKTLSDQSAAAMRTFSGQAAQGLRFVHSRSRLNLADMLPGAAASNDGSAGDSRTRTPDERASEADSESPRSARRDAAAAAAAPRAPQPAVPRPASVPEGPAASALAAELPEGERGT